LDLSKAKLYLGNGARKIGGKLVLITNRKSELVYGLSIGTKIGDLE